MFRTRFESGRRCANRGGRPAGAEETCGRRRLEVALPVGGYATGLRSHQQLAVVGRRLRYRPVFRPDLPVLLQIRRLCALSFTVERYQIASTNGLPQPTFTKWKTNLSFSLQSSRSPGWHAMHICSICYESPDFRRNTPPETSRTILSSHFVESPASNKPSDSRPERKIGRDAAA